MAALAEEIETPGDGQIRALDHAGRQPGPLHARTAARLDAALATLDFMVSVDLYLNETTQARRRHPPAACRRCSARTSTSCSCSSRCGTTCISRRSKCERCSGEGGGRMTSACLVVSLR